MGIIRTYFEKDTVIIRDDLVNTGRNPIVELFHGGSTNQNDLKYSRYICNFDLSSLVTKINNKDIFIDDLTHNLVLTNTAVFDRELYCAKYDTYTRATCFDLIIFEIPEDWCEGNGYDYVNTKSFCDEDNQSFCECAANWTYRETLTPWLEEGIYNGNPSFYYSGYTGSTSAYTGTVLNLIVTSQHFERGNENLYVDISYYINNILSFLTSGTTTATTYGLGVAFTYDQETTPTDEVFYTGFFSKDTNTVYQPFIQTTYNDTIKDDRNKFYLDKDNRLYLYTNAGGQATNASITNVTVYDQNDNIYQIIPESGITQSSRGVYYVTLNVPYEPTSGYCGNIEFRDVWSGITINGNYLGDAELTFIVKERDSYYNIGSTNSSTSSGIGVGSTRNISIYDYGISISGIKRQEKIKIGDTRKIDIEAKIPFTIDKSQVIDKIYYRIYIKEGSNTQIEYIPWTEVNRTIDSNYFILDTSWFIPNDYFLEVKFESGIEVRTYDDVIQFEITSEKDWRNSDAFYSPNSYIISRRHQ